MTSKKRPSQASLTARSMLQTVEDSMLTPIVKSAVGGISNIVNAVQDHIARSEAPGTYRLMLKEYYPSFPNWHEDPRSKSKEPFNPQNPREGRAGEVFFLEKYEKRDPELFERLMKIRIQYFKNLNK